MHAKLPASVRHGYGVGALAIAIVNTTMMFFLLKYLVDQAGLEPWAAGTVLLVGKGWDAVADPIIGYLSDRTTTSMGARRPWVLVGALPLAILFALTWWGLPWTGTTAIVGYAVLLLAYNAVYSAVVVPYGAMTPALTDDYDERTSLNGARMAWSMVGGIVAGVLMPMLVHAYSWRVAGVLLGALTLPPFMIVVWMTAGRDRNGATAEGPSMWSVLKNRSYRRVVAQFCASWTVVSALSSLVPFFVEHHLKHPEMLDLVFASIQLAALACIPAIVWLSNRMEKHTAYAGAMITWAVVLCGLALVPEGTGYPALIVCALAGPGIAAAHVLPWAMLPDVVEADRLETGTERAGAFYGMMTFLEKVVLAVSLWVIGLALQAAGYVEGAATQPESARHAILWLIGPLPGVFLLVAAGLALLWPPLTRKAHQDVVAKLSAG